MRGADSAVRTGWPPLWSGVEPTCRQGWVPAYPGARTKRHPPGSSAETVASVCLVGRDTGEGSSEAAIPERAVLAGLKRTHPVSAPQLWCVGLSQAAWHTPWRQTTGLCVLSCSEGRNTPCDWPGSPSGPPSPVVPQLCPSATRGPMVSSSPALRRRGGGPREPGFDKATCLMQRPGRLAGRAAACLRDERQPHRASGQMSVLLRGPPPHSPLCASASHATLGIVTPTPEGAQEGARWHQALCGRPQPVFSPLPLP